MRVEELIIETARQIGVEQYVGGIARHGVEFQLAEFGVSLDSSRSFFTTSMLRNILKSVLDDILESE